MEKREENVELRQQKEILQEQINNFYVPTCSICWDEFTEEFAPLALNCGHIVWDKCYPKITSGIFAKCPVCKRDYYAPSTTKVKI